MPETEAARQAMDPGPPPGAIPYTLPTQAAAVAVAIPEDWKGKFVRFASIGGRTTIRFSSEEARGSVVAVDPAALSQIDGGTGALTPDAGGNEPHIRVANGDEKHIRIDEGWNFFSYITDASTTCDACRWNGDGR